MSGAAELDYGRFLDHFELYYTASANFYMPECITHLNASQACLYLTEMFCFKMALIC